MQNKISTTGDLRAFLSEVLRGVQSETIDIQKANSITKIAGRINDSFHAEVKVQKAKTDAGQKNRRFGELELS